MSWVWILALRSMASRPCSTSSPSSFPDRSRRDQPTMALSGVRSSWERVARNWSFIRLAASASARASWRSDRAWRSRRPARRGAQLLGDATVGLIVAAARPIQMAERQHAQDLLASGDRYHEYGDDPECSQEFEVLAAPGRGAEPCVGDLGDVLGPAGLERTGHGVVLVARGRDEPADPFDPQPAAFLRREGVGPRHALDRPIPPRDVENPEVGQHRHDQPDDPLERLPVIQRRGERGAGVGQQALHLLAVLPLGDVAEVDRQAAVPERIGLHLEPAIPGLVVILELDVHTLGNGPLEFPLEPGAHGRREELPLFAAQQLFAGPAVDPLGLGVHVGDPPVSVQRHEAVGDALEDGLGLVAEFALAAGGGAANPGQLQVGGDAAPAARGRRRAW